MKAAIKALEAAGYAITKVSPTSVRDGLARAICRETIFDAEHRPDIEAIVEESWRYNIPDAEAALRWLAEGGPCTN